MGLMEDDKKPKDDNVTTASISSKLGFIIEYYTHEVMNELLAINGTFVNNNKIETKFLCKTCDAEKFEILFQRYDNKFKCIKNIRMREKRCFLELKKIQRRNLRHDKQQQQQQKKNNETGRRICDERWTIWLNNK